MVGLFCRGHANNEREVFRGGVDKVHVRGQDAGDHTELPERGRRFISVFSQKFARRSGKQYPFVR